MNKIKKLQVDDCVVEDQGQICEAARDYFQDLFMQDPMIMSWACYTGALESMKMYSYCGLLW